MISQQLQDRRGRTVSLREIGADWRAVADVAPHLAQRAFVFPLAARYMLLAAMEGEWRSLGIYADTDVVGHVMWAFADDGAHWIDTLIVDRDEQRVGVGAAAMRTLTAWLHAQPNCRAVPPLLPSRQHRCPRAEPTAEVHRNAVGKTSTRPMRPDASAAVPRCPAASR